MAKAVPTAASTALPPALRIDTPTSAAGGDAHTTMPLRASTGPPAGVSADAGRLNVNSASEAARIATALEGTTVIGGAPAVWEWHGDCPSWLGLRQDQR